MDTSDISKNNTVKRDLLFFFVIKNVEEEYAGIVPYIEYISKNIHPSMPACQKEAVFWCEDFKTGSDSALPIFYCYGDFSFRSNNKLIDNQSTIKAACKSFLLFKNNDTSSVEYPVKSIRDDPKKVLPEVLGNSSRNVKFVFVVSPVVYPNFQDNSEPIIDEDVVNFRYFFLLKRKFKHCALIADLSQYPDMTNYYFKMSDYLHFERDNDVYCYFKYHGNPLYNLQLMQKELKGVLHKFFPLLLLNKETYRYLVEESLGNIIKKDNKPKEIDTILKITKEFHNNIEYSRQRDRISGEVNRYSLLTYLYFSLYYMRQHEFQVKKLRIDIDKPKGQLSKLEKKQLDNSINSINWIGLLNLAAKQADGLKQIIENIIYHSSYFEGYLSFRIYDLVDGKIEHNLSDKYPDYFSSKNDLLKTNEGRSIDGYLLVEICDYSDFGIVDTFKNKIKNDRDFWDRPYSKKIDDIRLQDFFENPKGPFWDLYYQYFDEINNCTLHYGMQYYKKNVVWNEGYFYVKSGRRVTQECISSVKGSSLCETMSIEGTAYTTILPIYSPNLPDIVTSTVEIDMNLMDRFRESLNNPVVILDQYSGEDFNYEIGLDDDAQEVKNNKILGIANELSKLILEKNEVIAVDVSKSSRTVKVEMLFKSAILLINKSKTKSSLILAFYGMDEHQITDFIGNTLIWHEKMYEFMPESDFFDKLLKAYIYLYGRSHELQYIIHGKNVCDIRNINEKLASIYGYNTFWLTKITQDINSIIHKSNLSPSKNLKNEIHPLSVYINNNSHTIFEQWTKSLLDNEIENRSFGTKIPNIHARTGSKLHFRQFYEAELLFQSNYFSDRFAFLFAKEIMGMIKGKDKKRILDNLIMVGYGSYSEMLVNRIHTILGLKMGYIICEDTVNLTFSNINTVDFNKENMDNYKFAFVIPVNTSLTTFDKMREGFESAVKNECSYDFKITDKNLIYNATAILVRDESQIRDCNNCSAIEQKYYKPEITEWSALTNNGARDFSKTREIRSWLIPQRPVKCFVTIWSKWYNPILCELCYPRSDNGHIEYSKEMPLTETDKTSVVPFTIFEKDTEYGNCRSGIDDTKVLELGKYDVMTYGHIERNDNHFQYYFDNSRYYKNNYPAIKDWLKDIKKLKTQLSEESCGSKETNMYNFIISSSHQSNMGFVNAVNDIIFDGSAQIIRLAVDKEYRANIKTKYGHFIELYENIKDKGSKINFHFVDDTIVSGASFLRIKSLIRSIFNHKDPEGINIFSAIFLLLNRSSEDVIKDYINDTNHFYVYTDLFVESIRNPVHQCYLCNAFEENEFLQKISATLSMGCFWENNKKKFKLITYIETPLHKKNKEYEERANWYSLRLVCSHNAKIALNGFIKDSTDSDGEKEKDYFSLVVTRILRLLEGSIDCIKKKKPYSEFMPVDILISYFKAIARPPFSYRKYVRDAIFKILLEIGCVLLNINAGQTSSLYLSDKLVRIVEDISGRRSKVSYDLLVVVMKLLTELNSNFILRKEVMLGIWNYYSEILENTDNAREIDNFVIIYAALIKKLVCLYGDDAKATWLEYLLLKDRETIDGAPDYSKGSLDLIKSEITRENVKEKYHAFIDLIYLENNYIVSSSIDDLLKKNGRHKKSGYKKIINKEYYLESYKNLLSLNGQFEDFDSVNSYMVKLASILKNPNGHSDLSKKYGKIARCINKIFSSQKVFISVGSSSSINGKKCAYTIGLSDKSQTMVLFPENSITYNIASSYLSRMGKDTQLSINYEIGKIAASENYLENEMVEDENINYCIICYPIRIGNDYEFFAITCLFGTLDKNEATERNLILQKLKNILVFNHTIKKMIASDCDNDSIQNWTKEKHYIRLMTNVRYSDHSKYNKLYETYCILCGMAKRQDFKPGDSERLLLGSLTDMYIGKLNMTLLSKPSIEAIPEFGTFGEVMGDSLKLLEIAYSCNTFTLIHEKDGEETDCGCKIPDEILNRFVRRNRSKFIPRRQHLFFIFLEIINSAVKYGSKEENGKVNIYISITAEGYIILKNKCDESYDAQRKRKIRDALNRVGNGISLAVIKEFFTKFYGDKNGYVEILCKNGFFIIKLPILSTIV